MISEAYFLEIGCENLFFFQKAFLGSFEKHHSTIDFRYLIFFKEGKPVALALLQAMDVSIDGISENVPFSHGIATALRTYLSSKKQHILIVGNIFLSGAYGLFVKNGIDKGDVYDALSRKLKTIRTKKRASTFLLKDFNTQQDTYSHRVEKNRYRPFPVEPNMRLAIEWPTYEAYKAQLKSKYRVKLNKADSKSKYLSVQALEASDIRRMKQDLETLYCNITNHSNFNIALLPIETYASLKEHFKEKIHVHIYRKENKIVGFCTAFHVENILHAHFIGLDYRYNKTDAIYPRMLNDYVRLGIELGVKEVNLGRTASEIKSTLGAYPETLKCYVKHRKIFANFLFKPVLKQIKMTAFKQHFPYKSRSEPL